MLDIDALRSEVFRQFPHKCPKEARQLTGWSPRLCAICRYMVEKLTGETKW